jgi:hypothetical protein
MEEIRLYIKTWMKKKWYGEEETALGEGLLEVLNSQPEEIVEYIDTELSVFANRHPRYLNFLLDVRNKVRPPIAEEVEEECTPTEADYQSALVPSP